MGVLVQIKEESPIIAVAGVRETGLSSMVTESDCWNIGSTAKAMTAALMATYVEEGRLEFSTTIGEIFPDLAVAPDSRFKEISVGQLLDNSAGFKPSPAASKEELDCIIKCATNLKEERLLLLKKCSYGRAVF